MASVLQREVGVLRSTGSLVASADDETAQLAQEDAKSRILNSCSAHCCMDVSIKPMSFLKSWLTKWATFMELRRFLNCE
ncbi:hypothetical protein CRM82_11145 [Comamonas terrigena]|uniref:Uncharacterized protein n=2 Tax=Comamonadaceae TaxID=80864 RepID=A0A2A7UV55_COMTR|nr:hypothetical protein [Comamonas terrigena]PEH89071.1 hypothetical protein CRM82_11145 [Comamonas terrigena]